MTKLRRWKTESETFFAWKASETSFASRGRGSGPAATSLDHGRQMAWNSLGSGAGVEVMMVVANSNTVRP